MHEKCPGKNQGISNGEWLGKQAPDGGADGDEAGDDHEVVGGAAAELFEGVDFVDGVHRQQIQDGRDEGAADGFDKAEDGWVDNRDDPGGDEDEDVDGGVDLRAGEFLGQPWCGAADEVVAAFGGAEHVAEVGGDDCGDGDQRGDKR